MKYNNIDDKFSGLSLGNKLKIYCLILVKQAGETPEQAAKFILSLGLGGLLCGMLLATAARLLSAFSTMP